MLDDQGKDLSLAQAHAQARAFGLDTVEQGRALLQAEVADVPMTASSADWPKDRVERVMRESYERLRAMGMLGPEHSSEVLQKAWDDGAGGAAAAGARVMDAFSDLDPVSREYLALSFELSPNYPDERSWDEIQRAQAHVPDLVTFQTAEWPATGDQVVPEFGWRVEDLKEAGRLTPDAEAHLVKQFQASASIGEFRDRVQDAPAGVLDPVERRYLVAVLDAASLPGDVEPATWEDCVRAQSAADAHVQVQNQQRQEQDRAQLVRPVMAVHQ